MLLMCSDLKVGIGRWVAFNWRINGGFNEALVTGKSTCNFIYKLTSLHRIGPLRARFGRRQTIHFWSRCIPRNENSEWENLIRRKTFGVGNQSPNRTAIPSRCQPDQPPMIYYFKGEGKNIWFYNAGSLVS